MRLGVIKVNVSYKLLGNALFKVDDFKKAIVCYKKAF